MNKPTLSEVGRGVAEIPVHITYDIIRLFSEGLYRSPHKAIEELVSNSYDAGAQRVHVLLPEQPEFEGSGGQERDPLWVIDDGHGMDEHGFRQLWRVADSEKSSFIATSGLRAPIGQFGIGKLTAYVIAWNLTHLSKVNRRFLLTEMDFSKVTEIRQHDLNQPFHVSLREVDCETASKILADVETRDSDAWNLMFGKESRESTWTAVMLSNFRELYRRLQFNKLRWILSAGSPLYDDFSICLNGQEIVSNQENIQSIKTIIVGSKDDTCAREIGFERNTNDHIDIPGIGRISGKARIFTEPLTSSESGSIGRGNGFFVRVRGRVINLEDETFGVGPLNHAAWSRFAMDIRADGLRNHLLSSREGVKDSNAVQLFREYLQAIFNVCRSAYEGSQRKNTENLDIQQLLSDTPSALVSEPLLAPLRHTVETGSDSFYIKAPTGLSDGEQSEWLSSHASEIEKIPFKKERFEDCGPNAPSLYYEPETQTLVVNTAHPFVDRLIDGGKNRNSAELFASSEVLLEGQLHSRHIDLEVIGRFLHDRDRILRLMAGEIPPTVNEVLRRIQLARETSSALGQAVGTVFRVLGFRYQRNGGNTPSPECVLYPRLGYQKASVADYKLVYEVKRAIQPSVSVGKIDAANLDHFRRNEGAEFGFFIAHSYVNELDPESAVNENIRSDSGKYLTLLKTEHLSKLIQLHYRYGITLTELRMIFQKARTTSDVNAEIDSLSNRIQSKEIPLRALLDGLESLRIDDPLALPNFRVVRAKNSDLMNFRPGKILALLRAVEGVVGTDWIDVKESGEVLMHQTVEQIFEKFNRTVADLIPLPPSTGNAVRAAN